MTILSLVLMQFTHNDNEIDDESMTKRRRNNVETKANGRLSGLESRGRCLWLQIQRAVSVARNPAGGAYVSKQDALRKKSGS